MHMYIQTNVCTHISIPDCYCCVNGTVKAKLARSLRNGTPLTAQVSSTDRLANTVRGPLIHSWNKTLKHTAQVFLMFVQEHRNVLHRNLEFFISLSVLVLT